MTTIAPPETGATTFLWLELTGKCQLKCSHCYAESGPDGTHGTMTVQDWTRVIDEAAAMGVRTVQMIGGEPTLYPGLVDLIGHAVGRTLTVEVFTNLVHISPELWAAFSLPGVSLATSYYSDDADEHDAITGRPSYARTKANIAEANRRGIPLRAGVIDLGGGQRAAQGRTELVDLGVPSIGYDRLREIGRGAAGQKECASQLCGRCGDGAAAIGPDGTVTPCVMARWMPVGNVKDSSLSEVAVGLAAARAGLAEQGMPLIPSGECGPNCSPRSTGTNCYPHNDR